MEAAEVSDVLEAGNEVKETADTDTNSVLKQDDHLPESTASSVTTSMSKRAMKRLKKQERWQQIKAKKRQEEKEKKKRKFAEAREKGENLGPSRKALKKNSMEHSSCKQKVALDCSFDDYMSEKDIKHLVQQIQHSYSANRRADNPLQFYVCGVNGKAQTRLEDIGDYKGWDVFMKNENYLDVFNKDDVVYLSSESPNVLHELDETKAYIIGGLVDHNRYKGLCHNLAEEKGVSHAQLPISEYIDMKSRKVLTINHVFEILLRYTESRNWKEAFFKVIPQRKGFKEKAEERDQTECNANSSEDTENGPDQSLQTSVCSTNSRVQKCDVAAPETFINESLEQDTSQTAPSSENVPREIIVSASEPSLRL